MKILLVEDDHRIAEPLVEALEDRRYTVDVAADGLLGWDYLATYVYSLVLLDILLPHLDGIQLCQRMRRQGIETPVLMLTAKDTSTDKVMGLDAGADDYVVKPFDLPELMARVRALVRRGTASHSPVLSWGDVRLDPQRCQVTCQEQAVDLTPKEYQVLELLMRYPQQTFSRADILQRLWPADDAPGPETVKVHVRSIRKKLAAWGIPPDFIETVYGLGYRLR